MECPICAAPAESLAEGLGGLGVAFRHCGVYQIAEAALIELLWLGLVDRQTALHHAKISAPTGTLPMIAGPIGSA